VETFALLTNPLRDATQQCNVKLRPNVCRSGDPQYAQYLRGSDTIIAYLARQFPTEDLFAAARFARLRPRQIAELAWSSRCPCGVIHEGPVLRDGVELIEFRDPAGRCAMPAIFAVPVNLALSLVGSHNAHELSLWLREALADLPLEDPAEEDLPLGRQLPTCVRLTRTQYYFYSKIGIPAFSRIANAALRKYLAQHA